MDQGYSLVERQKYEVVWSTELYLFAQIGIARLSNLTRSIWWSILSKVLLRSRRTTAVSFFLSMAFRILSVVWMTDVSVECHCLFPLCLDDKRPLESRYDVSWSWATRSQTLERTGSSEIGLLLFGMSWSPAGYRGTFSCFPGQRGGVKLKGFNWLYNFNKGSTQLNYWPSKRLLDLITVMLR